MDPPSRKIQNPRCIHAHWNTSYFHFRCRLIKFIIRKICKFFTGIQVHAAHKNFWASSVCPRFLIFQRQWLTTKAATSTFQFAIDESINKEVVSKSVGVDGSLHLFCLFSYVFKRVFIRYLLNVCALKIMQFLGSICLHFVTLFESNLISIQSSINCVLIYGFL